MSHCHASYGFEHRLWLDSRRKGLGRLVPAVDADRSSSGRRRFVVRPRLVGAIQFSQRHTLASRGAKQPNGDGDQAKGYMAFPDRGCHSFSRISGFGVLVLVREASLLVAAGITFIALAGPSESAFCRHLALEVDPRFLDCLAKAQKRLQCTAKLRLRANATDLTNRCDGPERAREAEGRRKLLDWNVLIRLRGVQCASAIPINVGRLLSLLLRDGISAFSHCRFSALGFEPTGGD